VGSLKDSIFIIQENNVTIVCERRYDTDEFITCENTTTKEKIASIQIGANTIVIEKYKEDL
jgi:hypothetical protein